MAITIELLKKQPWTEGMSDDHLNHIVDLSKRDEEATIKPRIAEIYGDLDKDLEESSGLKKNDGEKTYAFAKRVGKELVDSLTKYTSLKKSSEDEVKALKDAIEKGEGGEKLKKDLQDAITRATKLEEANKNQKTAFDAEKLELQNKMASFQVDTLIAGTLKGLSFKADQDKNVIDAVSKVAVENIKGKYKLGVSDTGEIEIRLPNGELALNQSNALKPYTIAEVLQETLMPYGMLDDGKGGKGGGTGSGKGGGKGSTLDLSSCKSQVEVTGFINKHLQERGLLQASEEFSDESMKIKEENKEFIDNLPEQV